MNNRRLPPITKLNCALLLCSKAKELLEFVNNIHFDINVQEASSKIGLFISMGDFENKLIVQSASRVKDFAHKHLKFIKNEDEALFNEKLDFGTRDDNVDIMGIIRSYRSILNVEQKKEVWALINDIITVSVRF